MAKKTRVEIIVQGSGEPAAQYRERLQQYMDEVNAISNTVAPCMLMPTAASDGRMTTMIQWIEDVEMCEAKKQKGHLPINTQWPTPAPSKHTPKPKTKR